MGWLERSGGVALAFFYLAFRALLGALLRCRRGPDVEDIELLVLRHELEGTASTGGAAAASHRGSRVAGGGGPPPATLLTGRASGHPADALALASGTRTPKVAATARPARAPFRASRGAVRGAAAGTRESGVGPSTALRSRRVWLAGCSPNPTGGWVTQQARNLGLDLADEGARFLIRDRDSKYRRHLRPGVRQRRDPHHQDASASATGKRHRRALRSDRPRRCLDWVLIVNRRHLERALRVFIEHYNTQRSHRSLNLHTPQPREPPTSTVGESVATTASADSSTSTTETPRDTRPE